jgi:hypothetical protein
MYSYALFRPAATPTAKAYNDSVLGDNTLGIEVTVPALAQRCRLGNIDPQHQPGGDDRSAIETSLDHFLPPVGATLVTIRPDLDAFGAMAILTVRAAGNRLDHALRERVRMAGQADRFDHGPWPGPRAIPRSVQELTEALFESSAFSALAIAMNDSTLDPGERVEIAGNWLRHGAVPEVYQQRAEARSESLFRALDAGNIQLRSEADGGIATIVSNMPSALRLGYLLAPVVIAANPAHTFGDGRVGCKYTVAQWASAYADLDSVAKALNRREPGWGGSPIIKGSPQDGPSRFTLTNVTEVVTEHLCGGI